MVNGGWFRAALGATQRPGRMPASAKWPTSRYAGGIAFGPSVSPNVRPMEAESNGNDRVEFSGCHFPFEHPANRAAVARAKIMRISGTPLLASVENQRSLIRVSGFQYVMTFPGSRSSLAV